MFLSRWFLLLVMLFTLSWSVSGEAAESKMAASISGKWYSANKSITFNANGTIHYHGKRYYYAVSNGGTIQLKGRRGEMTIPFQLAGNKLALVEGGVTTVYRRR